MIFVFSDTNFALQNLALLTGVLLQTGNSIRKASNAEEKKREKPAIACDKRKALEQNGLSASTPKPRAEGSIPSAPATQKPETESFGCFFALFRQVYFWRTANDALLMLKLSCLVVSILTVSVRCSINKASPASTIPPAGVPARGVFSVLYWFIARIPL